MTPLRIYKALRAQGYLRNTTFSALDIAWDDRDITVEYRGKIILTVDVSTVGVTV